MSKLTIGLLVGAILGFLDGISAMLSPAVHNIIVFIVIASTIKGFVTDLLAGFVAQGTNNFAIAIVTGLAVGLALSFARQFSRLTLPAAIITGKSCCRERCWVYLRDIRVSDLDAKQRLKFDQREQMRMKFRQPIVASVLASRLILLKHFPNQLSSK